MHRMLHPDPSRRPTAHMLRKDPWIMKGSNESEILSEDEDDIGRETSAEAKIRMEKVERKQKYQKDIDHELERIQHEIDRLARNRKNMDPEVFKGFKPSFQKMLTRKFGKFFNQNSSRSEFFGKIELLAARWENHSADFFG